MLAALKAAGVEVEYRELAKSGHGDGFGVPEEEGMIKFFRKHLQNKGP